jgi:glycosyltransferase involved in cell wall biosynthesis
MVSNGKTGIVVAPNDVAALGRAMVSLTRDHKKLARMQRTVSKLAAATCSPQVIARAHLQMYRALIGRQSRQ